MLLLYQPLSLCLQAALSRPKLASMPVLVVGADTPVGGAIIARLLGREGEVRAFVSDPGVGARLKERGAKVAIGDPSDDSHVEGASTSVFSVVLVTRCLRDGRELAFADSVESVVDRWSRALRTAGVRRAIWVVDPETRLDPAWTAATPEHAVLTEASGSIEEIANDAVRLDEAASI